MERRNNEIFTFNDYKIISIKRTKGSGCFSCSLRIIKRACSSYIGCKVIGSCSFMTFEIYD